MGFVTLAVFSPTHMLCLDTTNASGCDDGNNMAGDGCDSNGNVEDGFICFGDLGKKSQCNQYIGFCGDGIITDPEACDDGNSIGGDGCSSTCNIERGWACKKKAELTWTGKHGTFSIELTNMNSSRFHTDFEGCLNACGDGVRILHAHDLNETCSSLFM